MSFGSLLPAYSMRQRGILQILFSGFCFGFLGLFGKWAFTLGLGTGEFLSLRFLLASLLLLPWLLLRDPASLRLGFRNTLTAFLLGVFGYAFFSVCYFSALRGLSVSLTVLLLYTYPVWVALGAHLLFRERLTAAQLSALPLALGGLLLLLWGGGELQVRDPKALGFGLLSAVLYSAYILASRRLLRGVPPLASAFYVMLGAGCALAIFFLRSVPVSLADWQVIGATALIGTVLAISLFLAGLQKLLSAEASLLSLAEPCTAIFIGALAFGERLGLLQWTGAVLIFGGLALVAIGKGRTTEQPSRA